MQRSMLLTAMLLSLCLGIRVVWSADSSRPEKTVRLTSQQQESALGFVKEHHPQLNTLITRLKKREPAEYHEALTDVFKNYERLQRLERRDRPRYEVELKLWKVNSRIRLLAARSATDQRPELESQLRELLNERTDLRLQQLSLERQRLVSRIERIDGQVAQLSSEREAMIDREVERLQRSVRSRSARVSRPSADNAVEKSGTSDRAEQTSGAEQKTGTAGQNRTPDRPAKKPAN